MSDPWRITAVEQRGLTHQDVTRIICQQFGLPENALDDHVEQRERDADAGGSADGNSHDPPDPDAELLQALLSEDDEDNDEDEAPLAIIRIYNNQNRQSGSAELLASEFLAHFPLYARQGPSRSSRSSRVSAALRRISRKPKDMVRVRRYMRKGANGPLHAAVWDKVDGKVIAKLVKKGADVNQRDDEGLTPLLLAVRSGQEEIVRALLDLESPDVKARGGPRQWTALHYAASEGHRGIAELILQQDIVEIDATDDDGWTPLHLATYMGHRAVVRMLLAHNADIECHTATNNLTPLYWAVQSNDAAMVQLLVDAGADPFHIRTSSGNSLLHVAVKKDVAIVQTLLGVDGVEVDVRRPDGLTPLWHLATYWPGPASEENVLVMKALLDAGADPNIRMGESKRTLLYELVPRKIWYIAPLLDTNIDINACMNIGSGVNVPLLAVVIKKSTRQAIDPSMLLMQRLMAGSTDFDTVPENEAIAVMRSLINKGADIYWSEHGATLLHLAAYLGLENIVEFISSHPNFDVNAKDDRGATALHLAVEENSPECVRALVKAGSDVEVQMGSETPLFKAARSGSLEIVKILLTEANTMTSTICGTYGDTALTIAARCLQKEVVKYLCQRRISLIESSDLGRPEVLDQEDVLLEAFAETFPPEIGQEHKLGWFVRKLVAARQAKEDDIVGASLRQLEPEPLQSAYARRKLIPLVPVC